MMIKVQDSLKDGPRAPGCVNAAKKKAKKAAVVSNIRNKIPNLGPPFSRLLYLCFIMIFIIFSFPPPHCRHALEGSGHTYLGEVN